MAANPDNSVALFATCLIDAFRPAAAFAAVALLERAGFEVAVPVQSCCGQPNFNGGDNGGARAMAMELMRDFAAYRYVVVPSASCAAMIRVHYPELFADEPVHLEQAKALAAKTYELTSFLVDVARAELPDSGFAGTVVMHDACSALRELNVREQPRKLLAGVSQCRVQSLKNADVCCGFGGLFCVKYPEISARMADKKIADIRATGSGGTALVSTDLGCLLHLGGRLHREDDEDALPVLHIAEVLAGMTGGNSD